MNWATAVSHRLRGDLIIKLNALGVTSMLSHGCFVGNTIRHSKLSAQTNTMYVMERTPQTFVNKKDLHDLILMHVASLKHPLKHPHPEKKPNTFWISAFVNYCLCHPASFCPLSNLWVVVYALPFK